MPDLGIARAIVESRRPRAPAAPAAAPPRRGRAPTIATDVPAGTVLDTTKITPSLMILRVARPAGFSFVAGQNVVLGLEDASHKYTIASAPEDPYLEFCIELVPNGLLTPRLFALAPGALVRVGKSAKGSLVLDESVTDHLMFATVTGVAPFISMLRHEQHTPRAGRRFLLVHGASFVDELLYREELTALAAALPDATYLPALSRPEDPRNAGFGGELGRLPSISARIADEFGLTPGNCAVYACGHPAMVAAIAAQLEAPGVPVATESFWRV